MFHVDGGHERADVAAHTVFRDIEIQSGASQQRLIRHQAFPGHFHPDGDAGGVGEKAHPAAGCVPVKGVDAFAAGFCYRFRDPAEGILLTSGEKAVDVERGVSDIRKEQVLAVKGGFYRSVGVDLIQMVHNISFRQGRDRISSKAVSANHCCTAPV